MTLQWTEDLAIGHAVIDNQHKELMDKFNGFLEAIHRRQDHEQLVNLFCFLDRYVEHHFREEELLMEQSGYTEFPAHRAEHQVFTRRLQGLRSELERTGPTIAVLIRTNKALLYWLTTHIKQVDVALGKYLAEL